jgi:hypothetical protein
MDNYKKFEKKVKNAKGKTKELRLSISEAEEIVNSVNDIYLKNERMNNKIQELERELAIKKHGTMNVTGSKF